MPEICAWLGAAQIFHLEAVLTDQIADACSATYRPFGDKGAGVRLKFTAIASDFKMVLIQSALAGSSCTWRSASSLAPMSMFDLVLPHPALRRDGASIVAAIEASRARDLAGSGATEALSAAQQTQNSRERSAIFGGLSPKTRVDPAAVEPPRLPLCCATTTALLATKPAGGEAQEAWGKAVVCCKPLHDLKKNISKAIYDTVNDLCLGVNLTVVNDVVVSVAGAKGEAQAKLKELVRAALGKNAFDMGIRGCEYRRVFFLHRPIFSKLVSEFHLQLLSTHDIALYFGSKPILSSGGWVMAELALICAIGLLVAVRLRADPTLAQGGGFARLSVHTALNNLRIMRRELNFPGIRSMHEEDAEGQFAVDKRVFGNVDAAGGDTAHAIATKVARRSHCSKPASVRSNESERVDVQRPPQARACLPVVRLMRAF